MYIIIKKNVHGNGFVGSMAPNVHPNLGKATTEASRMAAAHPGWEYIVCEFKHSYTNEPNVVVKAYN
jgi:hypothetical protein